MSSATLFLRNVAYIGYLKHICHCHQKLYLKSSSHFLFENITYVGSLKYFVFLHVFMMTYKQIYGHWTSRISTFILDPAPVCWRCAGVLWHQRVRDEQRGLRWELGLCQHRWKLLLWTMHFRLLVIKYDLIWLEVWGCLSGFVGNQNIGCSNRPGIWWVLRVFKK